MVQVVQHCTGISASLIGGWKMFWIRATLHDLALSKVVQHLRDRQYHLYITSCLALFLPPSCNKLFSIVVRAISSASRELRHWCLSGQHRRKACFCPRSDRCDPTLSGNCCNRIVRLGDGDGHEIPVRKNFDKPGSHLVQLPLRLFPAAADALPRSVAPTLEAAPLIPQQHV